MGIDFCVAYRRILHKLKNLHKKINGLFTKNIVNKPFMAFPRGYGAPAYFSTAVGGARKIAPAPDFTVREPSARGCFDWTSFGGSHPLALQTKNKQPRFCGTACFGVLERIRTSDPSLRRRVLYPAELRRRTLNFSCLLILSQKGAKVNCNLLFFGFFGIISALGGRWDYGANKEDKKCGFFGFTESEKDLSNQGISWILHIGAYKHLQRFIFFVDVFAYPLYRAR